MEVGIGDRRIYTTSPPGSSGSPILRSPGCMGRLLMGGWAGRVGDMFGVELLCNCDGVEVDVCPEEAASVAAGSVVPMESRW
jgi:hypothetical protein